MKKIKPTKHPAFIAYMKQIAANPSYAGMPDLINAKGEIQWEAPSNRSGGQFRDTHHKRRDWWRRKAEELGIDTGSNQWISKTAKLLHPSKKKPCSVCGKEMDIRYIYPSERLRARVRAIPFVPFDYFVPSEGDIFNLVQRLYVDFGQQITSALPAVFEVDIANRKMDEKSWLSWIEDELVPMEPRILSPGVMSNAPDRLDGFHTHNRCCRPTADKGRHASNLRTYVTDRRVFEYWSAGDWIAANELMGKIRSRFENEPCANGHSGPCAADHIGPISLGFCHRPSFRLLCNACNSARNNRMTLADVRLLLSEEQSGQAVISWHSQALWNAHKESVIDDETALRLSKQLRDNRHALMYVLKTLADAGHFVFLTLLLELKWAEYEVDFENLRIQDSVTIFDSEVRRSRTTTYSDEQKARRIRIAFTELYTYHTKRNRNTYIIASPESTRALDQCLDALSNKSAVTTELDKEIQEILALPESETRLRQMLKRFVKINLEVFSEARNALQRYMDASGLSIANKWQDQRYVRTQIAALEDVEG
jgi:Alw26I/Eco31I/Esp3I family type II restriction endonuclease